MGMTQNPPPCLGEKTTITAFRRGKSLLLLGLVYLTAIVSSQVLAQTSEQDLGEQGITRQRQAAIRALALGVASGALQLHPGAPVGETIAALKTFPGIGDWTAHYIAMRALHWPDAFPAGDVALHQALGLRSLGLREATRQAEERGVLWQPWRAYAVIRAWHSQTQQAKDSV